MSETLLQSDAQQQEAFGDIASSIATREEVAPQATIEVEKKAPTEVQSSLKENIETTKEETPNPIAEVVQTKEVEIPKEIETEIESKTALDYLKDDDDDIVNTPVAAKIQYKEEIEALRRELDELRNLQEDSETKAAIRLAKEAKATGKNIVDFIAEIKGEDVNKMSTKELFERKLSKYPELTEDERSYELEKFDGMSKLEQLEKTSDIKNELANAQKKALERYATDVNIKETQFAEVIKREAEIATKELEGILNQKDYKNLEITPERKKAIRKYVNDNLKNDAQGKFNVNKGVKEAIVALYEDELLAANRNIAKAKAKEELFKEITRPSKETPGTNLSSSISEDDELKQAQSKYWEHQYNKNNLTIN
jgi:hypothetical protein